MSNYNTITFGYGAFEVMNGVHKDSYALLIGKNGGGIVGEQISSDRFVSTSELVTVFEFKNTASINVVIEQLEKLKYKMENKLPYHVKNEYGEIIKTIKPKMD